MATRKFPPARPRDNGSWVPTPFVGSMGGWAWVSSADCARGVERLAVLVPNYGYDAFVVREEDGTVLYSSRHASVEEAQAAALAASA